MIAGKEHLYFLEKIAGEQTQIYQDACDVGILLNDKPEIKNKCREALQGLREIYNSTLIKNKGFIKSSTTTLFIPYEIDEGYYQGVNMTVNYVLDRRYRKEFLTITFKRGHQARSPFKN